MVVDRQTDKQTQTNTVIAILCLPYRGEVIIRQKDDYIFSAKNVRDNITYRSRFVVVIC